MLKLSDRPHPAWVRRPNPSVGQLRLHWLATHCVADPSPGVGEPQPHHRAIELSTRTTPKPDLSASRRSGSGSCAHAASRPSAPKPDLSASRRSGSAIPSTLPVPSASSARREARIIAMAAGRCADCGQPATSVVNKADENGCSSRPVCDACRTQRQGGPMADLMAGVMAQYAVTARSA